MAGSNDAPNPYCPVGRDHLRILNAFRSWLWSCGFCAVSVISYAFFGPRSRVSVLEAVIVVTVMATLLWPFTSWIRRYSRSKFGAERTTWSDSDEGTVTFEGAIRSGDGTWNHGRFVATNGDLSWFPRSSGTPRWETRLTDIIVQEIRSPKPSEWWSVNPNCIIVRIASSTGEVELVLFKSDLDQLRQELGDRRASGAL